MSRYFITIRSTVDRDRVLRVINAAPFGSRVEVKAIKRTIPQNDRMWAMLTEIAQQLPWHGVTLRPDDWKIIFLDALKRELKMVPNLDGTGFVNISQSSSDLTKSEMSDLIELIFEFGSRHGVRFADDANATVGIDKDPPEPSGDHPKRRKSDQRGGKYLSLGYGRIQGAQE